MARGATLGLRVGSGLDVRLLPNKGSVVPSFGLGYCANGPSSCKTSRTRSVYGTWSRQGALLSMRTTYAASRPAAATLALRLFTAIVPTCTCGAGQRTAGGSAASSSTWLRPEPVSAASRRQRLPLRAFGPDTNPAPQEPR